MFEQMKFKDASGHTLTLLGVDNGQAVLRDDTAKFPTVVKCAANAEFLEYAA